jgi:YVTN family beta-propeller protein
MEALASQQSNNSAFFDINGVGEKRARMDGSRSKFKAFLGRVALVWWASLLMLTVGTPTVRATTVEVKPFAYVTDFGGAVSVIDTATNTVVATLPVAGNPAGIAITPDGAFAYIGNLGNNTVSVIATATNTVVANVTVGTHPLGVAITPDGAFAYVANRDSNNVSVIATATKTVIATVTVGVNPIGVAVTGNGAFVYVANSVSGTVSVVATATNTVVSTVTVGGFPTGVAITPDGAFAYVGKGDTVAVIATATNTVAATVTAGTGPAGVAITPDGAFAYVTNNSSNDVSVIATATNTVVATVGVGAGARPLGIAITPSGAFAYVANTFDGVSVIATATNTLVATLSAGAGPQWVAFAPRAWFPGDVFASIGGGQHLVYHNTGTATSPNYVLVETLTDGSGNGFTYGCAFDSASNLFTTNFSNTKVFEFDANSPHSIRQTIDTNAQDAGGHSESVLKDSNNNLYVGDPDGGRLLLKYDPIGTFITSFAPARESRGTDWIDLAADQKTVFYTSEGTHVKSFDVSANTQLADFSSALTGSFAYALRLLPPYDGSGGLLVADSQTIVRLDATGTVVQTYDATCTVSDTCPTGSEDNWFGLTLDHNGTSFWAMDGVSGDLFRFNITSGAIEVGPISTGATFFSGGGVCVKGEPGAVNSAVLTFPVGTTTQVVTFNPGDTQNDHSWKATLTANTAFSITLTSHEVVCDTGVACNGDDFNGANNYRCRWEEYFSSDPQLPIGIPYSHGMCVYYRVENPPPDSDIGSDILFKIGYNNPVVATPFCSSLTGGTFTPRFFRDPSSPPPDDAALNHSFAFDITQGTVDESGNVGDPTISGDTTKTLNDYAVACRATTGATATWLKPAPTTSPTLPPTFKAGSAINLKVQVTSPSGSPIADAATSPNVMPLLITGPGGVSQTLAGWTYDPSDNWYTLTWKSFVMPTGTYTLCVNSTAFDYPAFPSTCTTLTLR